MEDEQDSVSVSDAVASFDQDQGDSYSGGYSFDSGSDSGVVDSGPGSGSIGDFAPAGAESFDQEVAEQQALDAYDQEISGQGKSQNADLYGGMGLNQNDQIDYEYGHDLNVAGAKQEMALGDYYNGLEQSLSNPRSESVDRPSSRDDWSGGVFDFQPAYDGPSPLAANDGRYDPDATGTSFPSGWSSPFSQDLSDRSGNSYVGPEQGYQGGYAQDFPRDFSQVGPYSDSFAEPLAGSFTDQSAFLDPAAMASWLDSLGLPPEVVQDYLDSYIPSPRSKI